MPRYFAPQLKPLFVGSKIILLLFSLFSFSFSVTAQNVQLNGKVLNSKNEALPGATISVGGVAKSLCSKCGGTFHTFTCTGKKYTVTVSSVGYGTKSIDDVEVKNGEDNAITIVLEEKSELTEVVVRTSVRKAPSALINFREIIRRYRVDLQLILLKELQIKIPVKY